MIRRPPRSTRTDTLFPYTTLFRSGVGRRLHPCLILGDIMQFGLTDDQTAIQEMARRFTADAITPHAAEWDEKHIFPRATVKAAAEMGFGAIYVSEASGGIGLGRLGAGRIMGAMAYGCR